MRQTYDPNKYIAQYMPKFSHRMKDNSHKQSVQEVSWNPVDGTLLSCSWDGTIKAHNINIFV